MQFRAGVVGLFESFILTRLVITVARRHWRNGKSRHRLGEHVHLELAAAAKRAHWLTEGVTTSGIKHLTTHAGI